MDRNQELIQIESWRRLLRHLRLPFTERSNGATLLVRAPGFCADVYAGSKRQSWNIIGTDPIRPVTGRGQHDFVNEVDTRYSPPDKDTMGERELITIEEIESQGERCCVDGVWMYKRDRAVIDEAPAVARMGRAVNKSTTLNDEAPVAPPRGDPLKAYIIQTTMNRPHECVLLDNVPISPAALARYALKKPLTFALDQDQERALQIILDSVNRFVVLIGKAGTGKSTVIRALESRARIAKCATTGKAAMGIDGITLDRLFKYDRTYNKTSSEYKLAENMAACPDIIVIDEASMIGLQMMNYIYKIAIRFNKRIILVGDWAQASPVKEAWPIESMLLQSAIVTKLTLVHRQAQGPYLEALDHLRRGEVSELVRSVFAPCMVQQAPEDDRFIRLFATNQTTDSYNNSRLSTGALAKMNSVGFHPELTDLRHSSIKLEYPMEPDAIDKILNDSPFVTTERFKAGARVVVTMNQRTADPDATPVWVNGDAGIIVSFFDANRDSFEDPGFTNPFQPTPVKIPVSVVVKLDRTNDLVEIPNQVFQACEANGDPIYEIRGMPLRLGWAVTIHRAQGMTVDKAFVDVGSIMAMIGESKHGLAYVALSRTRTLEGLQIFRWNDDAVFCAPAIKPFI